MAATTTTTFYTPTAAGRASIRVEVPRSGATVHIAVNGDSSLSTTPHPMDAALGAQPVPAPAPAPAATAGAVQTRAAAGAGAGAESWHNWAGNYEFTPAAWHQPRSEEELQDIVRAASRASPPRVVRVVGVGHSFNPMNAPCACDSGEPSANADGDGDGDGTAAAGAGSGDAVSLMFYKKVLDVSQANPSYGGAPTVTVQSGINLVLLLEALEDHGLTLANLPIVTSVTLGGALSTSAHGSGVGHGTLSGTLLAARLIDGSGRVVEVDSDPGNAEGHANALRYLPAVKVSLGALGVLSTVTLRVVPAFDLHVRELPMPFEACLDRLDELRATYEYFKAWWVPHTGFVHAFLIDRDPERMDADFPFPFPSVALAADAEEGYPGAAAGLSGDGRAVLSTAHAGSGGSGGNDEEQNDSTESGAGGAAARAWLATTRAGAKHLEDLFLLNAEDPSTIPFTNNAVREACFTPKRAKADAAAALTNGHWDNGNESNGCRFDVLEYALPAARAARALRDFAAILRRGGLYCSFPVDIRFSKREDDCWLSPAFGADVCWVGIPAKRPRGRETEHGETFAAFELIMVAHGGRPHWAKQHTLDPAFFARSYPRWQDFLDVRAELDPSGTFLNPYLRQLLGLAAGGDDGGLAGGVGAGSDSGRTQRVPQPLAPQLVSNM